MARRGVTTTAPNLLGTIAEAFGMNYQSSEWHKRLALTSSVRNQIVRFFQARESSEPAEPEPQSLELRRQLEKAAQRESSLRSELSSLNVQKSTLEQQVLNFSLERAAQTMVDSAKIRDQVTAATTENETTSHPIFGELVHDFGYKRCYAASVQQLLEVPVWRKQRVYNEQRARLIAQSKAVSPLGMPGVVTLYELSNGDHGVVDGQHRIGAMQLLVQQGQWGSDKRVLIEVFSLDNLPIVSELFTEINEAEPVKLVDLALARGAVDDDSAQILKVWHALHISCKSFLLKRLIN